VAHALEVEGGEDFGEVAPALPISPQNRPSSSAPACPA
jgi:hypothetical protein